MKNDPSLVKKKQKWFRKKHEDFGNFYDFLIFSSSVFAVRDKKYFLCFFDFTPKNLMIYWIFGGKWKNDENSFGKRAFESVFFERKKLISSQIHCKNKVSFFNKNWYFPKIHLETLIIFLVKRILFTNHLEQTLLNFSANSKNIDYCLRISQLLENN